MKRETKAQRIAKFFETLSAMGFSRWESDTLRRAQMTLRRWAELECGDGNDFASWAIERDEESEKPYLVTYPHNGKSYRRKIADRERCALLRIGKIVADRNSREWANDKQGPISEMPNFVRFYHQTDPRGCMLYLVKNSDIAEGQTLENSYNRGFAVVVS